MYNDQLKQEIEDFLKGKNINASVVIRGNWNFNTNINDTKTGELQAVLRQSFTEMMIGTMSIDEKPPAPKPKSTKQ